MHGCEEVVRILLKRWVICCLLFYFPFKITLIVFTATCLLWHWVSHCMLVENIVLYVIMYFIDPFRSFTV